MLPVDVLTRSVRHACSQTVEECQAIGVCGSPVIVRLGHSETV